MTDYVISTYELTRRFGAFTAVDEVALTVPVGSVYGFLGPNGAGKTTTIRMLLGLIRPTSGKVMMWGEVMSPGNIIPLRRVGALVEQPSLYPHLTGRQNLEITRRLIDADKRNIDRVLAIVDLQAAADRRTRTYSQGMKQRLGLALALLGNPELLILDEPTNGLDPAGIREMRDLICQLAESQGITIFLSSHLLSEVEHVATHIGIINHGKVCFQGALDELRAKVDDYVVLGVDQPDRAKVLLGNAGWLVQRNGGYMLTVATNGKSDVALLNKLLIEGGVNVYQINMTQPTLEDLFFNLTDAPQSA